MKFLSRLICRRLPRSGKACALALTAAVALGCGPDFPNSYYDLSTEALLAAPEGFFAAEIARLTAEIVPSHRAVRAAETDPRLAVVKAELADLRRSLAERGMDARRAQEIEWAYETARAWLEAQGSEAEDSRNGAPDAQPKLPADLPAEFAHYFEGALAWRRGAMEAARTSWQAVLALPARERRYRSTWAAFMLGRMGLHMLETNSAEPGAENDVARAFRDVRAFANSGFPDPLGLAAASLGWEAKAALAVKDYPAAVRLYLEHYATGDDTAIASLRYVAKQMIQPESELARHAQDADCRRVLTAHLISRARHFDHWDDGATSAAIGHWAQALAEAEIHDVQQADRLAWLAYDAGEFELAQRWLDLAPATSAEAAWVRAKLALRQGELTAGETLLRDALRSGELGAVHRGRIAAELGRVCLAQNDYAGALAAWMEGQHWEDAAYVAERLMSTAELVHFVEERETTGGTWGDVPNEWFGAQPAAMLRHLLARCLARAGEFELAHRYYPDDLQPVYETYLADVRAGFDLQRSIPERAASFWRAAQVVRERGLELLGTELEPDWAIWGGWFALVPSAERRSRENDEDDVFAPSSEEIARRSEARVPTKRYHYRYRAAELAWWAASLMPNDEDATAEILYTAGGWLKHRDPEAAKPFYQALVIRCGNTELGREAAHRRWLPENP